MIQLLEFLHNCFKSEYIVEMATIGRSVRLDSKRLYKIAIHGPSSNDRDYPHIHIYDANDVTLKDFNFEISVIDLLSKGEINLLCQVDKKSHLRNTNRSRCSWTGYRDLRDNFEDWLYSKCTLPGTFIDNLDAIIWNINNESHSKYDNYILQYMSERGLKVMKRFQKYFSKDNLWKFDQLT